MIVAIAIWPLRNMLEPMVAQLPQERREAIVAKVFLQDLLLLQVLGDTDTERSPVRHPNNRLRIDMLS